MYAVIESGGKQYRVEAGQTIKLEKLPEDQGGTVKFEQVLMVGEGESIKVGTPYVEKASVSAEVLEHGRGKKVNIIKFRRRKQSMSRQGHRQDYTQVLIKDIQS